MKVYILTIDDTVAFDQTLSVSAFSTFEKAQKEMNTQIKNFEENTGTEYNQKITGKNYYSVYNENNYNEDHFEMLIRGKEIL